MWPERGTDLSSAAHALCRPGSLNLSFVSNCEGKNSVPQRSCKDEMGVLVSTRHSVNASPLPLSPSISLKYAVVHREIHPAAL